MKAINGKLLIITKVKLDNGTSYISTSEEPVTNVQARPVGNGHFEVTFKDEDNCLGGFYADAANEVQNG